MELDLLKDILNSSKEYEFIYGDNGMSVLVIKKYYDTNKKIKLDLSKIDDEILKKLIVKNESEDDYNA